jgi:hypothetical protein
MPGQLHAPSAPRGSRIRERARAPSRSTEADLKGGAMPNMSKDRFDDPVDGEQGMAVDKLMSPRKRMNSEDPMQGGEQRSPDMISSDGDG